jgi:hypothetical protein
MGVAGGLVMMGRMRVVGVCRDGRLNHRAGCVM